jgi:hypothetical protein
MGFHITSKWIAVVTLVVTVVNFTPALAQQPLPSPHSFSHAGFHLGMSKRELRLLIDRSDWHLPSPDSEEVRALLSQVYPWEFYFIIDKPDSLSCIGPTNYSSGELMCDFFDSVHVVLKDSNEGVYFIRFTANGFRIDNNGIKELRRFINAVLDRVSSAHGKPHQLAINPDTISANYIKMPYHDVRSATIAKWEWRDPDDPYHLVKRAIDVRFQYLPDFEVVQVSLLMQIIDWD